MKLHVLKVRYILGFIPWFYTEEEEFNCQISDHTANKLSECRDNLDKAAKAKKAGDKDWQRFLK